MLLPLLDLAPSSGHLLDEIELGLRASPAQLPAKLFYDERGMALFGQILEQSDYYPVRLEWEILNANIQAIADALGPSIALLEYGSGAGAKTRRLLSALDAPAAYLPIDIAGPQVLKLATDFAQSFPSLAIHPICADFTEPFDLPRIDVAASRSVIYFAGTTVGNFPPTQVVRLLKQMKQQVGSDGAILVSVDGEKPPHIMEQAYDDVAGITRRYAHNGLSRLVHEFGFAAELRAFDYQVLYVADSHRIEMRLPCLRPTAITNENLKLNLKADEYLLCPHSYKYSQQRFSKLASKAGLAIDHAWHDDKTWFGLYLLSAVD